MTVTMTAGGVTAWLASLPAIDGGVVVVSANCVKQNTMTL